MSDNKSSKLIVNIVTPDGLIYSHEAIMLIVHAFDGDLGILVNHEPILTTLKIDKVRIKRNDINKEDEVAVNGGFLEFSDNIASIVADSAELKENIDLSRAQLAFNKAQKDIEKAKKNNDSEKLKRAEIALRRAINRINIKNSK